MKQVKLNAEQLEGYAITVEVEGSVEEYAISFLHIFNNVRESKELLKVKNYYGSNDITVYCELEHKGGLEKYLKMFGKIKSCEKILIYQTEEPEYNIDEYDGTILVPEFE